MSLMDTAPEHHGDSSRVPEGERVAAALARVEAGLAVLAEEAELGWLWPDEVADAVAACARAERRLASVQARLSGCADELRLGADDGCLSGRDWVAHRHRVAPRRLRARQRLDRLLKALPDVAAALAAGRIGVDQVDLLARMHARNAHVRWRMPGHQPWFIARAQNMDYPDFEAAVRQWETTADDRAVADANERTHRHRHVDLVRQNDGSWRLSGSLSSLTGAAMAEIIDHYVRAELAADWARARAEHGDDATEAHLGRSDGQRRADACWKLFDDAAGADGSAVPVGFVHNIVWDAATFEEMARRFDGGHRRPLDPEAATCRTLDGVMVEPTEAFANSLEHRIRRVLIDSAGVTIDLGMARCFTGGARLAVQVTSPTCIWPGCHRPASRSQIDHLHPHGDGGATRPDNGAVMCGAHNRFKTHGYTVYRDPAGRWHISKPDGTRIE